MAALQMKVLCATLQSWVSICIILQKFIPHILYDYTVFLKQLQRYSSNKSAMKDRVTVYEENVWQADGFTSPLHSVPREGKCAFVCLMTLCQLQGRNWRPSSGIRHVYSCALYSDVGYSRTLVTIFKQYIWRHPKRLDTSHCRPENLTSCWRQNFKSHVQLCIWRDTRHRKWGRLTGRKE